MRSFLIAVTVGGALTTGAVLLVYRAATTMVGG